MEQHKPMQKPEEKQKRLKQRQQQQQGVMCGLAIKLITFWMLHWNIKSIKLDCHLMTLVLGVMYTKTLHRKGNIKQREESQKHPNFLFTHKQEAEVFQKNFPLQGAFLKLWIKTKFIRVVIPNLCLTFGCNVFWCITSQKKGITHWRILGYFTFNSEWHISSFSYYTKIYMVS